MHASAIEVEVQHRADQRLPEVLFRLMSRRKKTRKVACSNHSVELSCYVTTALIKHRRWKSYRDGHGKWQPYNMAHYHYCQAQMAYRDSVFHCGCSDKYNQPSKRRTS